MATGSELVLEAYREGNLIGPNASLTLAQANEGLIALNNFLETLYGYELGDFAGDWAIPPLNTAQVQGRFPLYPTNLSPNNSNIYLNPPPNARLLINSDQNITVTFPQSPDDGARMALVGLGPSTGVITFLGNGRTIEGSFTLSGTMTNLTGRRYFYRADMGDWTLLAPVTADSSPILPRAYDDFLALGILDRLSSRLGRQLTTNQSMRYRTAMGRLRAQFRQRRGWPVEQYDTLSTPAADFQYGGNTTGLFGGGFA